MALPTVVAALGGLFASFVPEIIKYFKDKQEHKQTLERLKLEHEQELERLKLELQYHKELTELKLMEAKTLAQIELDKAAYQYTGTEEFKPTGNKFADILQVVMNAYNQSVRPTITYLLIGTWLLIKYAMWQKLGGTLEAIPKIWSENDESFLVAVITFWFGHRGMLRTFEKIKVKDR